MYALGWAWEYMMVDLGLDLERIKYAQGLIITYVDSVLYYGRISMEGFL